MIDLYIFCESDSLRSLGRPFYRDGYTYASNGHIAVRVSGKHAEENEAAPNINLPRLWDHADVMEWTDLPTFEPQWASCIRCEGSGKSDRCEECCGDGEVEFENDFNTYHMVCKSCDGDGYMSARERNTDKTCSLCNGLGRTSKRECIPFSTLTAVNQGLNSDYLLLMQKLLTGIQIEKFPRVLDGGTTVPAVRFRFDGGEGALMPMWGGFVTTY